MLLKMLKKIDWGFVGYVFGAVALMLGGFFWVMRVANTV